MKKVLVVGSAVIDILMKSRDLKVMKSHEVSGGVAICEVYGGKTVAEEMMLESGGSATNVSVGLVRLGVVCSALTRIGKDWLGTMIKERLSVEGVDVSNVIEDDKGKTGVSVVLVAVDGGRSIITYRGASAALSDNEVSRDTMDGVEWLQLGAVGGDLTFVENMVSMAKMNGAMVGYNPGGAEIAKREALRKVISKIDLLVMNRMEASTFLGVGFGSVREMAIELCKLGDLKVVITDGKKGAGVYERGRWIYADAFRVKSVDDTGAGDAFVAGFLSGLLKEEDLGHCLKMGLANGASEVREIGAKSGLLSESEMRKWLKKRVRMVEEKI